MLAKQIINLDLQLIEAKTKQFSLRPPAAHPPAPLIPATNQSTQQLIQLNDLAEIFIERPLRVPHLYWPRGQLIGAPVSNFRQIRYLPLSNVLPNLDQSLSMARLDCGPDFHKQLIEFSGAAKE